MTPPPASYGPVVENLVDLQTLSGHGNVVGGDVGGARFGAVVVEDRGRYRGRSVVSYGLVQGLQRATDTRQWASAPGIS